MALFLWPNVYLKALTVEAQSAIFSNQIVIPTFPFRVGRERRAPHQGFKRDRKDRRGGKSPGINDLYLWENIRESSVSVEHFLIERDGADYFLRDRHSNLGTWVDGKLVGGNRRGGRVILHDGDVIIIGSHRSGFIFKFFTEKD